MFKSYVSQFYYGENKNYGSVQSHHKKIVCYLLSLMSARTDTNEYTRRIIDSRPICIEHALKQMDVQFDGSMVAAQDLSTVEHVLETLTFINLNKKLH